MKRSPELSPFIGDPGQATSLPAQKKFKAAISVGVSVSNDESASTTTESDVNWTKVEKRKAKKMRKTEAKLDVCVSLPNESIYT